MMLSGSHTRAIPDLSLANRFSDVRAFSEALCVNLSESEATVQSMPDASPAKWHLAHTSWFFETFVLRDYVRSYRCYDARYRYLFNSYYEAEGERLGRASRGLLIRPSLQEIVAYRKYVDMHMRDALDRLPSHARDLVVLGCQHEEQHQELILMDLQHLMYESPLQGEVWRKSEHHEAAITQPLHWIEGVDGPTQLGCGTNANGSFAFDCERPRHTTWLPRHTLADRPVTNREWREFIADGGYRNAGLWLSDGWSWSQANRVDAPLYWGRDADGNWCRRFGLDGWTSLDLDAPVCHVSYYEADAYARWAGARLPTEAEWEAAACWKDPTLGNFLDEPGPVRPLPDGGGRGLRQLFGDVWEWTASAFLPYPGFAPAPGAVGEYNGKFMSGQFVLRGGCCATPRGHVRASYRNFFYPHQRWMFAGVRLARTV